MSCALPTMNSQVPLSTRDAFKKRKLPTKNQIAIKRSLNAPNVSYRRCITTCRLPMSKSSSLSLFTDRTFKSLISCLVHIVYKIYCNV